MLEINILAVSLLARHAIWWIIITYCNKRPSTG